MDPAIALEVGNVVQLMRDDMTTDGPFLVQYVSPEMLELTDPEGRRRIPIKDGEITPPPGVVAMRVIYTPPQPGYVALIGAKTGDTVSIELDNLDVVRGTVASVEHDMLEIKVGEKALFLDFAYRGIDPSWGIRAVRVAAGAPPPAASVAGPAAKTPVPPPPPGVPPPPPGVPPPPPSVPPPPPEAGEADDGATAPLEEDLDAFERALEDGTLVGDTRGAPPVQVTDVQQDIIRANKIRFIGQLGDVSQKVAVSEEQQRYTLPHQIQDLLDSMLSEHSTNPDPRVLRGIQQSLNRFRVLYRDHTKMGGNGIALGPDPVPTTSHPLASALTDPMFSTFWLLPTTMVTKKFYDTDGAEELGGIELQTLQAVEAQRDAEENAARDQPPYSKGRVAGGIMAMTPYLRPYASDPNAASEGITIPLPRPAEDVIVDQGANESYAVSQGALELIAGRMRRAVPTGEYSKQVPAPLGETLVQSELAGPERQVLRTGYITLGAAGVSKAEAIEGSVYDRASAMRYDLQFQNRHHAVKKQGKRRTDAALPDPGAVPYVPSAESYGTYLKRTTLSAGEMIEALYWQRPGRFGCPNLTCVRQRLVPYGAHVEQLPFDTTLVLRLRMQEVTNEIKAMDARRTAAFQRYAGIRAQAFRRYSLDQFLPQQVPRLYRLPSKTLPLQGLARVLEIDQGTVMYYEIGRQFATAPIATTLSGMAVSSIGDTSPGGSDPSSPVYDPSGFSYNPYPESPPSQPPLAGDADPDDPGPTECRVGQVAKHYTLKSEMDSDLQKALTGMLRFDPDMDPTRKEALEAVPRPPGMEDDEYSTMLRDHLVQENGLRPTEADAEADALVRGGRQVRVGDYVTVGPLNSVFQLGQAEWIGTEKETTTGDGKTVCADKLECVAGESECAGNGQPVDRAMTVRLTAAAAAIMAQSGTRDAYGQEAVQRLERLRELNREMRVRGAADLASVGRSDEEAVRSPHMPLLQAIIGQGDFATKQLDLIRFEREFTVPGPTEWVRACKDTQIPIFPTFLSELAEAFQRGEYTNAIEKICATRGRLSEMGDMWVDVHSGMPIKPIADVADPEAGAGGELPTVTAVSIAELLAADAPDVSSEEMNIVQQVTKAIVAALGVQLTPEQSEVIHSLVSSSLAARLPPRTEYEARRERAKGKGGKLPSYDFISENMAVLLSMCAFIVAVQTGDRAPRVKRVIAGCPRSLMGYPLNPDVKEDTAIRTVACVVNRIKTDNPPWRTLAKMGEPVLMKQMMKFLALMIDTPTVAGMLEMRRAAPVEDPEPELGWVSSGAWPGYLPPADPPKRGSQTAKPPKGVTYTDYLASQRTALLPGFTLQAEQIEQVSRSKPQLLTVAGAPYSNNACCAAHTLRPKDMDHLVDVAIEAERHGMTWRRCARPPAALLTRNTRPLFPAIPQDDAETTQEAIMHRYCGGDPAQSASALAECPGAGNVTAVSSRDVLATVFEAATVARPTPARAEPPDPRGFLDRAEALAQLCVTVSGRGAPQQTTMTAAVTLNDSIRVSLHAVLRRSRLSAQMREDAIGQIDLLSRISNIDAMIDIVEWVGRVWPAMIANNVTPKPPPTPRHWGLSQRHAKDIEKLWTKQVSALVPFYAAAPLIPLLRASSTAPSLAYLITRTVQLVQLHHRDKPLANEIAMLLAQNAVLLSFDFTRFLSDGAVTPKQLGPMIAAFARLANAQAISTPEALQHMRHRLLVAKEKEKDSITDYLKDMSDEQREIENLMKNSKLGKWSKGQSKELYSYTRDAYDTEMAELEQREAADVQLQDAIGRVRVGDEMSAMYEDPDVREALDMSGMANDDDYGDGDGDEDF